MPSYECDLCGACCRGHLIVEAYEIDLLREPRLASADPHYCGRPLSDVQHELADEGKCIVLAAARPCMFLNSDCRCQIYPTRPNACVAMEAGDEQCQLARLLHGLPPLEPVASDTAPTLSSESVVPLTD
jgi:Fe-S-cluster containining protein